MGPIHWYAEGPAHNSDNTKHLHFFIQRAILQPTEKIHNEHSKTNGQERLAWQESHTENRGGGFENNEADETSRGGHRSAIWRTGYVAYRVNIQKQTVWSDWRGRSCTRKIEEEDSQKNEAAEVGTDPNDCCLKNRGHLGVCLVLQASHGSNCL